MLPRFCLHAHRMIGTLAPGHVRVARWTRLWMRRWQDMLSVSRGSH
jgi:hypothetical protein